MHPASAESFWTVLAHPLMAPVALSMAAGCVAYAAGRWWRGAAAAVALIAAVAAFAMTGRALMGQQPALEVLYWQVSGLELWIRMGSSALGGFIAAGSAFFAVLVCVFALGSLRGIADEGRFYAFLCWALAGAIGTAYATDLVWLLICWEFTTLALYLLLNLHEEASAEGAAKAYGILGFSDAAMLLGIALVLILTGGSTRTADLSVVLTGPLSYAAYALLLIAALAKAGAIPLHSWIPAAAGTANAATLALLPAAIDKLLGIYLLARLSLDWFIPGGSMRVVLMLIGTVTILAAVVVAMAQRDLKRLLAFQAVGQVGYMVLGIGTGTVAGIVGGLFHMLNHAIYDACLFLSAGAVERRTGQTDLDRLGGLARAMPAVYVACGVAAMAISGVPPFNGFVSKWLVYQGCLQVQGLLGALCLVGAVFGSALTLASFVKVLGSVFLGSSPEDLRVGTEGPAARAAMTAPLIVLALLCIVFGVYAQWPLQHLILPAAGAVGVDVAAIEAGAVLEVPAVGLWAPGAATWLIILGLLGGMVFYLIGKVSAGRVRVVRPFVGGDVVVPAAAQRHRASGFYLTIQQLPGLRGMLADGGRGAYDVYRVAGHHGHTLVELLRRQHTGVLGLYVTWAVVGVVVIVGYLMIAAQ